MRKVKILEFFYHVLMFAMFAYCISIDFGYPAHKVTYAGRLKYYTVWNICLAIFYYGFSSLVDLIHLLGGEFQCLRKFRDYIFCSMVVPASMNVSVVFWTIYAMNPDFILTKEDQVYQPVYGYFNQVAHTGPIVSTFIEALTVYHVIPSRFWKGCLGGLMYGSAYTVWLYWVAYKAGFWVYPFLGSMNEMQRFAYFAISFVYGFFCYYLVVSIIRIAWKRQFELDQPILGEQKKRI